MTNKFETPELDKLEDMPPLTPMWETHWPSFATALCEKLAKGHLEYGDVSFEWPAEKLLGELAAEALDLAGWGFILYTKIQKLKSALREAMTPEAAERDIINDRLRREAEQRATLEQLRKEVPGHKED